jgi:hypothetical protein
MLWFDENSRLPLIYSFNIYTYKICILYIYTHVYGEREREKEKERNPIEKTGTMLSHEGQSLMTAGRYSLCLWEDLQIGRSTGKN